MKIQKKKIIFFLGGGGGGGGVGLGGQGGCERRNKVFVKIQKKKFEGWGGVGVGWGSGGGGKKREKKNLCSERDSNPRPSDYKSCT